MKSACGLRDLIGNPGSQESRVSKNSGLRVRGMVVVIVVISRRPHDVDLNGAGRTLLRRKMRNTS